MTTITFYDQTITVDHIDDITIKADKVYLHSNNQTYTFWFYDGHIYLNGLRMEVL